MYNIVYCIYKLLLLYFYLESYNFCFLLFLNTCRLLCSVDLRRIFFKNFRFDQKLKLVKWRLLKITVYYRYQVCFYLGSWYLIYSTYIIRCYANKWKLIASTAMYLNSICGLLTGRHRHSSPQLPIIQWI